MEKQPPKAVNVANVIVIVVRVLLCGAVAYHLWTISTPNQSYRYYANGVEVTGLMESPAVNIGFMALIFYGLSEGLIRLFPACFRAIKNSKDRYAEMDPDEQFERRTKNLATASLWMCCLGFFIGVIVGALITESVIVANVILDAFNAIGFICASISIISRRRKGVEVNKRAIVGIVLCVVFTIPTIILLCQ